MTGGWQEGWNAASKTTAVANASALAQGQLLCLECLEESQAPFFLSWVDAFRASCAMLSLATKPPVAPIPAPICVSSNSVADCLVKGQATTSLCLASLLDPLTDTVCLCKRLSVTRNTSSTTNPLAEATSNSSLSPEQFAYFNRSFTCLPLS